MQSNKRDKFIYRIYCDDASGGIPGKTLSGYGVVVYKEN
jgi:hypothetical protein